jgi:hypothetical protein
MSDADAMRTVAYEYDDAPKRRRDWVVWELGFVRLSYYHYQEAT